MRCNAFVLLAFRKCRIIIRRERRWRRGGRRRRGKWRGSRLGYTQSFQCSYLFLHCLFITLSVYSQGKHSHPLLLKSDTFIHLYRSSSGLSCGWKCPVQLYVWLTKNWSWRLLTKVRNKHLIRENFTISIIISFLCYVTTRFSVHY